MMLECWMHVFIHLIVAGVIQVSGGLSWVRVTVPHFRVPGEMAQLLCDYDLGEDVLYSVKWYKDHEEFYRYVPKAHPPQHSYRLDGLQVDLALSDSRKVVLRALTLKSSGLYRCEVSAEAPSFASAQSEARMEVVYLPKEDPQISGVELQYQIGDEINLNCTSGKSHPASVLHWYINEQQVASTEALVRYPPVLHRHSLVSSTLGLRFILSSRHFLGGSMRVKCVASVSPVLWQGDRESVVQRLAPLIDNREALLLGEEVASTEALVRYPPVLHRHSLVSSTLGLRFILSSRHFLGGSMRVKCVASVSPVLWQGDRESVVQRLAPLIDNREALLLVKSTSSGKKTVSATVLLVGLILLIIS